MIKVFFNNDFLWQIFVILKILDKNLKMNIFSNAFERKKSSLLGN
jgi:hypothetical protein